MKPKPTSDTVNLKHLLVSGLIGTSAMTAFSYLVSEKQGRYFKEPEILNDLLYRLLKVNKSGREPLSGFLAHYTTGALFSTIYHILPKEKDLLRELGKGLVSGLALGLAGIAIWKTVFKLHPDPPAIHLKDYLGHLIAAHLVFGETLAAVNVLLEKAGRDHGVTHKVDSASTPFKADTIGALADSQKVSR
jgi:hypothetical protein